MAQSTSYNVAGNREDLTDLLTILEPEDTPVLSTITKTKRPTNTYQEWQVDNLAPVSFPGVVEGKDVSTFDNKSVNRARIGNYIQIFQRPWAVSQVQELMNPAGISSEVAQAKAKGLREIKRDIESAICSDNEMRADNGVLGWNTRGFGNWIKATAQTVNAVPTAYLTPSAAIDATATASLTEANFNAVFQAVFEQNGGRRNYQLFAGPSLKSAVSNFQRVTGAGGTTKTYQVTQDASENAIDLNVEMYRGDYHDVQVIPTLFNGRVDGGGITAQVRARGYVIDPELVGWGYMKGIEQVEFPPRGGGRSGVIEAIGTVVVKNPLGLGKFAATS
jgi:uncharacterized protein YoaH (UPF0181 family)